MAFITKEKLFSKKWFITYGLIVLGSFIMSAGFVLFISPYKFAPGGVYGISIVIHHLTGAPIGITALLMDIPLTILGIKILGPRFGVKTVIGFILTAVFVDTLSYFWGDQPLVQDDPLLSAIFGGVLVGFGLGLIFKSRATSGGSDIIAMIVAKYTKLPLGQLMIIIDSLIVLIALVAFKDWKIPLYSWIVIFVAGKVIDLVLQGVNYDKTLFIISDKYEEIREKIINDLERGGTLISAQGMYKGAEKKIVFTVVSRREMSVLEDYIRQIDSNAFISVINANEIIGKGFRPLNEEQH